MFTLPASQSVWALEGLNLYTEFVIDLFLVVLMSV